MNDNCPRIIAAAVSLVLIVVTAKAAEPQHQGPAFLKYIDEQAK